MKEHRTKPRNHEGETCQQKTNDFSSRCAIVIILTHTLSLSCGLASGCLEIGTIPDELSRLLAIDHHHRYLTGDSPRQCRNNAPASSGLSCGKTLVPGHVSLRPSSSLTMLLTFRRTFSNDRLSGHVSNFAEHITGGGGSREREDCLGQLWSWFNSTVFSFIQPTRLYDASFEALERKRLNEMTLLWFPTDKRRKDADKVSKYQDEMRDMTDKTTKLKAEVKDLTTAATIFQTNNCAYCSSLLDLPALHCLSRLSYHQRCLTDVLECNEGIPTQNSDCYFGVGVCDFELLFVTFCYFYVFLHLHP